MVHDSAGGRSRSPAVVISYLMAKDKLSYESAVDHVKALRPVVSLNAGFEAQLRCLERANGNVFAAHQLHLQSKLGTLVQHQLDGSLELTKRRQNRHQQQKHTLIPRTPPHPSMSIRSQQVSCCDDRGMLDGNLPSGFSLSLPIASKKKKTQFIPALRSMGSMFGCRTCGEHLFCASAVIQHDATSDLNHTPSAADTLLSSTSRSRHGSDKGSFRFEEPVANETDDTPAISLPGAESGSKEPSAEHTVSQPPPPPPSSSTAEPDAKKTRKPMLAKLRLRPQSPSVVSSPTGSDKSTPRSNCSSGSGGVGAGAGFVDLQQVHPSALAGKPDQCAGSRDGAPEITARVGGGGVLKSLKKEKMTQHDARVEKDECAVKSAGSAHGLSGKGGGPDKFWRTLTAFAATKRIFKDNKDKKQPLPHSGDASPVDEKKRVKTNATFAAASSDDADGKWHSSDALFLRENAVAWERNLRAIEKASSDDESAVLAEIAALIAADAKMLSMLNCEEWFIEPQEWFLDGLIQSQSGAIRCPNGGCGAVVGQWRWDGLRYVHCALEGWSQELGERLARHD